MIECIKAVGTKIGSQVPKWERKRSATEEKRGRDLKRKLAPNSVHLSLSAIHRESPKLLPALRRDTDKYLSSLPNPIYTIFKLKHY